MRLLQAHHRVPIFDRDQANTDIRDHVHRTIRQAFYDELDGVLQRTPGGILLAQPKLSERKESDWLLGTGGTMVYSMTAVLEELPEPPLMRLIGGPADGHLVRTAGQREWLVPFMPATPTLTSYVDMNIPIPRQVAVYERQGDTATYFYKRTTNA